MIALVSASRAVSLDADLAPLQAELPESVVVVWDDPVVDWSSFDAAFIRSTWDYQERRDEFLSWAALTAQKTRLWNPVEVIEWNTDKRYLSDLSASQVPTVPTTFLAPGDSGSTDLDLSADIVVKPSVGAGSNGVIRSQHDFAKAEAHVESLHRAGLTAMVQPYLVEVDQRGETCLVFFGGEFSHAFQKGAILNAPIEWEGGLYAEEKIAARRPSGEERSLADRVIAAIPSTAYARIDMLPTPDGPVVLEVEVTEPSVYFQCDPAAAARAAAVFRNLAS